jgi:hypothetical protein
MDMGNEIHATAALTPRHFPLYSLDMRFVGLRSRFARYGGENCVLPLPIISQSYIYFWKGKQEREQKNLGDEGRDERSVEECKEIE